jgi:hypothetical protein
MEVKIAAAHRTTGAAENSGPILSVAGAPAATVGPHLPSTVVSGML